MAKTPAEARDIMVQGKGDIGYLPMDANYKPSKEALWAMEQGHIYSKRLGAEQGSM